MIMSCIWGSLCSVAGRLKCWYRHRKTHSSLGYRTLQQAFGILPNQMPFLPPLLLISHKPTYTLVKVHPEKKMVIVYSPSSRNKLHTTYFLSRIHSVTFWRISWSFDTIKVDEVVLSKSMHLEICTSYMCIKICTLKNDHITNIAHLKHLFIRN